MSSLHNSSVLLSSFEKTNSKTISHAANQSVRPYNTNQEYLFAMREDLADWLKGLYAVDIDVFNFFDMLEIGTLLCQHANNITTCAEYVQKNNIKVQWKYISKYPTKFLAYNQGKFVQPGSFFARDNIASFIGWCRNELEIPDSIMFETNDLVLRYNEKNVILCLLEVARRGSRFGVPAPMLVQMEEEIDEEIELEKFAKERNEAPRKAVKQRVTCDFKSLDEMVQYVLGQCTCPSQFPMVKISDGKYKVGDSENLIFMRILRQHVMVRVGGGWDTLEHYLNKHDPCRCLKHKTDRNLTPRHTRSQTVVSYQSTQQQQRTPTTTSTPRNVSASNKNLSSSRRLARSTNNLNELSLCGKPDKTLNSEKRSFQSRRTSTSDNSTSDTRPLKSRRSHTPERNSTKYSLTRKDQATPQADVFTRLSRPKSTPPISKNTQVFQEDLLLVQRNKKGTHQIQRASTPARNQSKQQSQPERTKSKSVDRSHLRSKSTTALLQSKPTEVRLNTSTPRQRKSATVVEPRKAQTPRTDSSRKLTRQNRVESQEFPDERELELLHAFERECIANQYTLQHEQLKPSRSRYNSIDSVLKPADLLASTSQEDNEVALHMSTAEEDSSNLSHPPSSYHSLPRPRKDKNTQHDRRTRIPTPVSFNKPLMTSRSVEINGKESKSRLRSKSACLTLNANGMHRDLHQKKDLENKSFENPHKVPPTDIRHPRTSLPLDKINLLLNMNKHNVESALNMSKDESPRNQLSHYLDQTFLRSSGNSRDIGPRASAFAPIENRTHDEKRLQAGVNNGRYGPTNTQANASPLRQNSADSVRPFGDQQVYLKRNFTDYHGNESPLNSDFPSQICDFTPKSARNGLTVRPSSTRKTYEPQWV